MISGYWKGISDISNRKIPVSFKSSSNFLFRCPDVGNETHHLVSIIPRWQRKIKHYVFLLLKPKVCLHDDSNMQKSQSQVFLKFVFLLQYRVKYPVVFSSSWLFDHCGVEGRGEREERREWPVGGSDYFILIFCNMWWSRLIDLYGWTMKLLFLLVKMVTYQQFHMLQHIR